MGNVNSMSGCHSSASGRVVLWDGSIQEFNEPLTVAELMLEYPRQVVVEIQSAVAGKRPTPLPADKKLDPKKVYLMLPIRGGKPASLSFEEIRRVLLCANSALRSRSFLSSSRLLPWFARICPAATGGGEGTLAVQIKKEEMEILEDQERGETEMPPESLDVRPEYLSRQLSGKGWKPSLDTITEKKIEKKFSHWLFKW